MTTQEQINVLESRQIALSNEMASSDAHASKCIKLDLNYGETYPEELASLKGQKGMVSHAGKYYSENGTTYLCTRNSINPLYYPISQLINHYFHTVE